LVSVSVSVLFCFASGKDLCSGEGVYGGTTKMMRNLLSRRVDFWSLPNSELVVPLDSLLSSSSSSSFSDDVDKVEHEEADARNED
jgi:hypothetical protein